MLVNLCAPSFCVMYVQDCWGFISELDHCLLGLFDHAGLYESLPLSLEMFLTEERSMHKAG